MATKISSIQHYIGLLYYKPRYLMCWRVRGNATTRAQHSVSIILTKKTPSFLLFFQQLDVIITDCFLQFIILSKIIQFLVHSFQTARSINQSTLEPLCGALCRCLSTSTSQQNTTYDAYRPSHNGILWSPRTHSAANDDDAGRRRMVEGGRKKNE